MIDDYQMGNVKYSSSNSPYYFYAPVRALYGELMIPVYDLEYSHDEVYVSLARRMGHGREYLNDSYYLC